MKNQVILFSIGILCFAMGSAYAQVGAPGAKGPPHRSFSASTAKLFGENTAFTASLETKTKSAEGEVVVPGMMAYDQGKSRFEMNMGMMKGSQLPPEAAAQMKSMGMDRAVTISRPDKKVSYQVFPNLRAYVEHPLPDQEGGASPSDYKADSTELGKEVVEGHPCIKHRTMVTGKDGKQHEAFTWNASDLKKFPIKIEQTEQGNPVTMLFRNVNLAKPADSLFEVPAGFQKYDSVMSLMQQEMTKRMGGMPGAMPPQPGARKQPPGR